MKWINIKNREPKGGNIFCKINGRKEIVHSDRLRRYKNGHDEVFWLDEFCEGEPIQKLSPKIEDTPLKSLENLFGIKEGRAINARLRKIKSP